MADDLLYHYTSAAGFQGIVENCSLWMTDIEFLNDVKEGVEFFDIASVVLNENPIAANDENIRGYIEGVIKAIADPDGGRHFYSLSFSKKPDLLSQWRGYCPVEGGYCLGFDEKVLSLNSCMGRNEISQSSIFHLGSYDCVYDENEKKMLVVEFIRNFIDWYIPAMNKKMKGDKSSFITGLIRHLDAVSILRSKIKNSHFKEEDEKRIVAHVSQNSGDMPNYRRKGNVLIPYLTLPFRPEYLKKIIIGPCSDQALAKKGLERHLSSLIDSYDVEIECSDIPYRQL